MGRLLIEAQGGESRAKYGNQLIKEYSLKLTEEVGRGYSTRNLKYMRKYYLFRKRHAVHAFSTIISWNHYKLLLGMENITKIQYYINISESQNLSYRDLEKRIRSNEYERIGYKEELEEPKINTLIKKPIIIKSKNTKEEDISEWALHKLIMEDIDSFLKELGNGFTYCGHEVKIKIGSVYNYIDFLLFNYVFNCFVIIEIKTVKMKAEYVGQVLKYMHYVDKHIKKIDNENSVGIVICKKDDKYILEYCSDERLFTTTYEIKSI